MKNKIFVISLLILLFSNLSLIGQIVYTEPALPTADESVLLYFNAEGTPLEGYTGVVYAHTGVTVNGNIWQNVIGSWGNNSNQPQLTKIDANLYKLNIDPTIRAYYDVAEEDEISQMSFVFRSADTGTQTSPDIFVDVYEEGLNVQIIFPDISPYFVDPGENINIEAEATEADEMSLYVDNELIVTVAGNILSETIVASTDIDTKKWITIVASNTQSQVSDSIYYYVRGATEVADLPDGVNDGINYIDDQKVTLVIHAPYKSSVYAFGDFSDWQVGPEFKLKRNYQDEQNIDTRYWVTLSGLTEGEEYGFQYLMDETLVIGEPYTDKVLDPWNDSNIPQETYPNLKPYPTGKTMGIVSVFQTAQEEYQWQIPTFDAPPVEDLIVYEMLMRDFTEARNFQTVIDTISYFKRLGVNAIELMPVNEFEGNDSWGYNPSYYFAADKYYGTKDALKDFIDECHANGIAVILDIVLNHAYGQCVLSQMYWDAENGQPAENSPWFNTVSPNPVYHWGNDFNHESQATKDFVDRVNRYWMSEYKFDGFRFDFTKGFTNTPGDGWAYDAARIEILKRMADSIWAHNPDAYVILEHLSEGSEEKVLADYGMILWGNMNSNYNEATMGYHENGKSNFSRISYKLRAFDDPHLMGYMESHDEERLMAKNIAYGNSGSDYDITDTTTALTRIELAAAFFYTVPGPKMLWQFGELGYDYHINYPGLIGGSDNRLTPKPVRWDYQQDARRDRLYQICSALIKLRNEEEAFSTDNFTLAVVPAMKRMHLNHSSMNVTIIGNFDVTEDSMDPQFQHTGYWYDYFAGDSIMVDNISDVILLQAGEYRIYTDVKLETPEIGLGIFDNPNKQISISTIYPNPSDDQFNISFNLSAGSFVEVNIYNLNGQKVKSVYAGKLAGGNNTIVWDGLNNAGTKVNKGMFLAELIIDGQKEVKKLIVK
ncbi:MAG: T9SS type A sorting domain-containing protein [Bacteroidales bacterium]|nr:T9SS type A sorting domain-containing protein [Bacteroidales bacterium]